MNKHEAPEPPDTLSDRFRDAIAPRTLLLGELRWTIGKRLERSNRSNATT